MQAKRKLVTPPAPYILCADCGKKIIAPGVKAIQAFTLILNLGHHLICSTCILDTRYSHGRNSMVWEAAPISPTSATKTTSSVTLLKT